MADMDIGVAQDFTFVGRVHGDENVLPRGTFGGDLDPGFAGFYPESNVVHFDNFSSGESWEHFSEFKEVFGFSPCCKVLRGLAGMKPLP